MYKSFAYGMPMCITFHIHTYAISKELVSRIYKECMQINNTSMKIEKKLINNSQKKIQGVYKYMKRCANL